MPRISPERLEARRREILDGARACFARYGYEGATVRLLEQELGMSRGAIFHHFRDKEALFLALAEEDADEMSALVGEDGLVGVMRTLPSRDSDWLGTQLEITRRLRTDPDFARQWKAHQRRLTAAARARLEKGRDSGTVRDDVDLDTLVDFLQLVLDGLVLHRAMGMTVADLGAVLDLVEASVRTR